jgi:hypothetical protein
MKKQMTLMMKKKIVFSLLLFCGMHALGQGAKDDGAKRAYCGIELLVSNPALQINHIEPGFGHEYLRSGAVPVSIGAGWSFRGKRRLGGSLTCFYLPLNFDIDFNFNANPDPLIPAFSEFRNDYISAQMSLDFALVKEERFELFLAGGIDLLFLINYSESTIFTNAEIDFDRFRSSFSNTLGAIELGGGGRYFIGGRFFAGCRASARYFAAPIENMEFTDLKNLSLGLQAGFGYLLKAK